MILEFLVTRSDNSLYSDCYYKLGAKFGLLYEATNIIEHLNLAIT